MLPPGSEPTTGPLILAAGGVVWRRVNARDQIALIHRRRYGDYALPKGKLDAGESFEAAALREVREETGVVARIRGFAGAITYRVGDSPKLVVHFHLEAVEIQPFEPNGEVAEVLWLSRTAALKRMTYGDERSVVRRSATLQGAGDANSSA